MTDRPAPAAWCTRQRSSLGRPPPRTATPDWPAAITSHSSKMPPPPSTTAIPTPAGLSTVQARTVGRPPPRTSIPAADRVTIRRPVSSGVPSSTRTAGTAASCPSMCSPWTCAEARTASGTPSGGAIRTDPADPSCPSSVTARSTTRFSRYVPGATVRMSPSAAASRAAVREAYSPVRRRHREVPVCVTWTVPCAMVLLCPHLVYAGPADCRRRSPAGPP